MGGEDNGLGFSFSASNPQASIYDTALCQRIFIGDGGRTETEFSDNAESTNFNAGAFISSDFNYSQSAVYNLAVPGNVLFTNTTNAKVVTYTYSSLFQLSNSWFYSIRNEGTMEVSASNLNNAFASSNKDQFRGPVFDVSNKCVF